MDEVTRDLLAYYEAEAGLRARGPLTPPRAVLVEEAVALLAGEGRTSIVEFGAGPGGDGERFVAAGLRYVGIDLAHGNARLAAERGVTVVQADLTAPPLRPGAFEAGWSMSTLMHLPAERVPAAVRAIAATLAPGAPLFVGLWGGDGGDVVGTQTIEGHRRLFSLRPPERNAELLAGAGRLEWSTVWDLGDEDWVYQVFRFRVRSRR